MQKEMYDRNKACDISLINTPYGMNVITLNVNGLLKPIKRSKILTQLNRERVDVAFLQDTYLTESEHGNLKQKGFKQVFASTNKSRHNRGVAILTSRNINSEHLAEIKDKEGRYILIREFKS